MYATKVGGKNVPVFLVKLWKLVEDEKCNDLISWSSNGQSFIIHNQAQFAKELLPVYFKHNNMASLIRQLNLYGFRKVVNIDQGLRSDQEEIEFSHNFFNRCQEGLLKFIKRKVPTSRAGGVAADDGPDNSEVLKELLANVVNIQSRQEHMGRSLDDVKKENKALWREVARLHQKDMKQQQIVDKLIQFLVTLVQANRSLTVKRKVPLMLEDGSSPKVPRLAKATFVSSYQVDSPAGSRVSKGPVVRVVTDLMEDLGETSSCVVGEPLTSGQSPSAVEVSRLMTAVKPLSLPATTRELDISRAVFSPLNAREMIVPLVLHDDESSYGLPCDTEEVVMNSSEPSPKGSLRASPNSLATPSVETVQVETSPISPVDQSSPSNPDFSSSNLTSRGSQVALQDKPVGTTKVFAEDLESSDSDLDWIQDELISAGLNLDTSTLMRLFSPEDILTSSLGELATESKSLLDPIGSEIVQYMPSLFDLDIEKDSTLQPVNELLLPDDEVPSSSSATGIASSESTSRVSSLVTCEKNSNLQPTPSSLNATVQSLPQFVEKKETSSKKKRRRSSKK